MTIFEERERAAEYGFTQAEELRFLASRAGIEALALWAADGMRYEGVMCDAYVDAAIGRFVSGESEESLVTSIGTDLERFGKPDLAREAGGVFTREAAAATDRLYGRHPSAASAPAADHGREHHRHAFWGWTV